MTRNNQNPKKIHLPLQPVSSLAGEADDSTSSTKRIISGGKQSVRKALIIDNTMRTGEIYPFLIKTKTKTVLSSEKTEFPVVQFHL